MKKIKYIIFGFLFIFITLFLFGACSGDKNITFNAVVDDVNENSLMVSTVTFTDFDKASVRITNETKFENIKTEDIKAGDSLEITIKPEIAESYPVQVTAVKIKPAEANLNTENTKE